MLSQKTLVDLSIRIDLLKERRGALIKVANNPESRVHAFNIGNCNGRQYFLDALVPWRNSS